jgi:hypothetical protein
MLHVGTFPRPSGVFPAGGRPGERVTVRWLGDGGDEFEQMLTLPGRAKLQLPVFPVRDGRASPSTLWVNVADLPTSREHEPNDELSAAQAMEPPPFAVDATIGRQGDVDRFRIRAKKGEPWRLEIVGRRLGSPLDSVVSVQKLDGTELALNDDMGRGQPDSELIFRAPADGEYLITVRDQLRKGGPGYFYRVVASRLRPSAEFTTERIETLTLLPAFQDGHTVSVPRGNRFAALFRVTRRDEFAGAVELRVTNLPKGVAAHSAVVPANAEMVPMVFEAGDDARLSGTLAEPIGKTIGDSATPVEFRQPVALLYGPPAQTPYHNADVDRVAVAVTEAAPFRIDVASGLPPVIAGSATELSVKISRSDGFRGPVTLSIPFRSNGISAPSAVVVAPSESHARIPLDVAGDVEPTTYPLVIVGQDCGTEGQRTHHWPYYDAKGAGAEGKAGGSIWVSSPLLELTIMRRGEHAKPDSKPGDNGNRADRSPRSETKTSAVGESQ